MSPWFVQFGSKPLGDIPQHISPNSQSLGLASFPLLVAYVYEESGEKYIPNCEFIFAGFAILGITFGFILNLLDYNNNWALNSRSGKASKQASEEGSWDEKQSMMASDINYEESIESNIKQKENEEDEPSKTKSPLRWLILFLTCLLMLGNYYCFDIPSASKDLLESSLGSTFTETKFALLYSLYSYPNVIIPFFGGVLVDKLGTQRSILIFTCFILAGQILLAIGINSKVWWLMFLGRIVFGLGGENLSVGQSAFVAEWFGSKEVAFAFGINLSCSRLGSVINDQLTPWIAKEFGGVAYSYWFGAIMCIVSLVCAFAMAPVNYSVSKWVKDQQAGMYKKILKITSMVERS